MTAASSSSSLSPPSNQYAQNQDGKYATLKYGRVYYRLMGEYDPNADSRLVVFVHGIGGYHFQFERLAMHLLEEQQQQQQDSGKKYQILLFDLYGRGYSDMPPSNVAHNEELFLEQMRELLEHLQLVRSDQFDNDSNTESEPGKEEESGSTVQSGQYRDSFVLIGHSMGGALSLHFAARYPHLVSHLILLSSAGLPWTLPRGAGLLSLLPQWMAIGVFKMFQKIEPSKEHIEFYDPQRNDRTREVVRWFMDRRYVQEHASKYYPAFMNTMQNSDLMKSPVDTVAQYQRPTLILFAQYDVSVSPPEVFSKFVELFSKHNDRAYFAALRDTRHSFFNERHNTCANIIAQFLSRDHNDDDCVNSDGMDWIRACVDPSELEVTPENQQPADPATQAFSAKDQKMDEFWADEKWSKYLV